MGLVSMGRAVPTLRAIRRARERSSVLAVAIMIVGIVQITVSVSLSRVLEL